MEGNNLNQNNQNINTPRPEPAQEVQKKSIGPVIGIAIIVVIIIFGGLYYWGAQINKQDARNHQESLSAQQIENEADPATQQLQTQSQSDEIVDIETDLNTTDLENLDQELENIDLEFSF